MEVHGVRFVRGEWKGPQGRRRCRADGEGDLLAAPIGTASIAACFPSGSAGSKMPPLASTAVETVTIAARAATVPTGVSNVTRGPPQATQRTGVERHQRSPRRMRDQRAEACGDPPLVSM
jgi:hypothetical protein